MRRRTLIQGAIAALVPVSLVAAPRFVRTEEQLHDALTAGGCIEIDRSITLTRPVVIRNCTLRFSKDAVLNLPAGCLLTMENCLLVKEG